MKSPTGSGASIFTTFSRRLGQNGGAVAQRISPAPAFRPVSHGLHHPVLGESRQQEHDKKRQATLAALGIVFGGSRHPVPITPNKVLGTLSLFFWALLIVVTLKYVSFIMGGSEHISTTRLSNMPH